MITLAMLLSISIAATAANTPAVKVTASGGVTPGAQITFTVSVSGSGKVHSAMVVPVYDKNLFELVSGEWLVSGFLTDFSTATGDGVIAFTSATDINCQVFQFTLKVKSTAAVGASGTVSCSFAVTDVNDTRVEYTAITGATVKIECPHSYTKKDTSAQYRKSTATCTAEAVYYYSCTHCGAKGSKTFTSGGKLAHDFTKQSTDARYLASAGDCLNKPQYYYSCTACGEKGTQKFEATQYGAHSYTYPCDTACRLCDAPRQASHSYGSTWQSDQTGHWHVCNHCGTPEAVTAHSPGPEATETEPQSCTICGFDIAPALGHTHRYEESLWICDKNGHWRLCLGCQEPEATHPHSVTDGKENCDVCGYYVPNLHNHVYGSTWISGPEGHWQECACGQKNEVQPHASEENGVNCAVCGYYIPQMHIHVYGDSWICGPEDHWQVCACGVQSQQLPHERQEGTDFCAVCKGYMPSEHVHQYLPQWKHDTLGHWQACVCGSMTALASHDWDAGEVSKEATTETEGCKVYTCRECGAVKEMLIPKMELLPDDIQGDNKSGLLVGLIASLCVNGVLITLAGVQLWKRKKRTPQ